MKRFLCHQGMSLIMTVRVGIFLSFCVPFHQTHLQTHITKGTENRYIMLSLTLVCYTLRCYCNQYLFSTWISVLQSQSLHTCFEKNLRESIVEFIEKEYMIQAFLQSNEYIYVCIYKSLSISHKLINIIYHIFRTIYLLTYKKTVRYDIYMQKQFHCAKCNSEIVPFFLWQPYYFKVTVGGDLQLI